MSVEGRRMRSLRSGHGKQPSFATGRHVSRSVQRPRYPPGMHYSRLLPCTQPHTFCRGELSLLPPHPPFLHNSQQHEEVCCTPNIYAWTFS